MKEDPPWWFGLIFLPLSFFPDGRGAAPWWCPYMVMPIYGPWPELVIDNSSPRKCLGGAAQWNGSNLMMIFINSDHLLVKSDFSFNIIKFPNVTAEQWTSPSSYLVKQKSKESVKNVRLSSNVGLGLPALVMWEIHLKFSIDIRPFLNIFLLT